MPERCHMSFMTFLITLVILVLHEACVHAAFISDYDTLFQKLLSDSDELSVSRPKRLEYQDDYEQNNFRKPEVSDSLISKIDERILPEPFDRINILPSSVGNKHLLSKILVDRSSKRAFAGKHDSQPAMTKLLTIIDKLDLPEYKLVTDNGHKRNQEDNENTVFGSLMQAAYRLGELDANKPPSQQTSTRRFHAWGG